MIHLVTSGDTLRGTMQKSTPSGLLHLVSPRSILYKNIHQALCPLEPNPIGLMIASEPSKDQWFNVHLPRYDLHFTLNDHNELECQNAPGYIINDDRQGVGCLFGLQNILCLRQSIGSHRNYKVIIPQGEYETQVGQYGHPLVSIKSASLKGCFIYDVDTHVGRLVGTRSTESDILLVKLHAYTSSSLPDPLTRRTGTSEALSRLQSASSYTFSSITDDWKSSLEDLAKITPLRTFYPAHLRVMESVTWHPSLPASSQSINFRYIVEDIIAYARNTLVFHQKHELVEALPFIKGMDFLSLRANQRDWTYQSNFASTSLGDPKGVTYIRPPKQSWDREAVAFRITSLSRPETYQFPVTEDFLSQVIQWNRVEGDRDWTWDKIHEWIKVPAITSISEVWCSLYELCRKTPWPPTFEATATLALLGYCGVDFRLISTLFAVMRDPRFRQGDLACTRFKSLSLRDGREWDQQVISQIIQRSAQSFGQSEESRLPKRPQETNRMHEQRIQNLYNLELDKQVKEATQEARQNWPQLPARIILSNRRLLDATPYWIEHNLYPKLETWLRNRTFLLHVDSVQRVLSSFHGISASTSLYEPYIPTPIQQLDPLPKLLDPSALMREHPPPEVPTTHNILSSFGYQLTQYSIPQTLRDMLSRLKGSRSCAFHDQYNQNLEKSILSLSNVPEISMNKVPALDELITNANLLSKRKRDMLDQMIVALEPSDASFDILRYTRSLPAITPYTLLQLLSFGVRDLLPPPWINCITSFAAMILDAQRNERMLKHMCAGKLQQLAAEASIQSNWSHLQNTDWLLVQIDGNFSIRSNQMEVALDMMASEGAENKLLQLNMGEGKSSVIVPVVAASVANGDALCRVIVPRAQTGQQLHRLRLTVTDLCNRRIIKLPFSRNTSLDDKTAVSLLQFLEASRSKGAIWLAEPEQLLSLKLLGLDKAMRYRRNGGGDALIKAQLWLNENTRDILDESDDVLHTRQQVIYTVGKQKDLDASPRRWEVVQRMLGLLAGYLSQPPAHFEDLFYKADPPGISGFPLIRIFSEEGRELLKTFIHQSLQRNDWALPPGLSSLAQEFVTSRLPSADTVLKLYAYCSGEDEYVLQTLLILRGMIGCDILVHSLKDKRWRVNYGLDLSRTYLAIPFRAKDFPSPRSEFGHPDVTILLTCLSYYYQGLDDNMVQHCIKQLLKSSTPDLTYTSWIQSCWEDVPLNFRTIRGINMEDEEAIRTQLYCYLRYNKEVIDFYLNSTVFPKEAKEFPAKLCTSGWDIACKKAHITTGFSGTNDDRFLLPSTIYQHDRDAQLHTNAKVLSYLLLEENRIVYSLPSGAKSHDFLERVMEIPLPTRPKVILDVGAQILDKSNLQFAKDWLSLYEGHSSIKAAIYFDEGDTLMAVSTDGTTQTLMDSPYSERLDQCLVYLDDAHTRGTDLRLPDMRAVVTLGPKMTKDKLVQGCMRMRKLGDGHTLVFMATDEVLDSIANISNVPKEQVTSFEVLIWAIKETWTQLQSNLPAWVLQGYSFAKRQQAWEELALREQYSPQYLLDTFGENEARPLKELYRVKSKSRAGRSLLSGLRSSDNDITSSIKERCKNFETFSIHEASVHEEMEVELVHEKEVEREVERLPSAQPDKHVLRRDVVEFVQSGQFPPNSSAFRNARVALTCTSLNLPSGFDEVFRNLYFTEDFCRTVTLPLLKSTAMDNFLRPVEWLVTPSVLPSSGPLPLVALSPFEANELLPLFRRTTVTRLHIFHARSNLSSRSLESLCSFSLPNSSTPIPRSISLQLNLFSGALYIQDEQSYRDICKTLRLHLDELPDHLAKPEIITSTCFVKDSKARIELGMTGPGFDGSPLPFLRQFITLRRYGKGFGPAHMGKILHGIKLEPSDFGRSDPE
ncbi:hypothetical protein FRC16_002799 [Serendipita sp. 398]|nr:hypothetical protein FRC16_002799 [Serendipita sp. 398]